MALFSSTDMRDLPFHAASRKRYDSVSMAQNQPLDKWKITEYLAIMRRRGSSGSPRWCSAGRYRERETRGQRIGDFRGVLMQCHEEADTEQHDQHGRDERKRPITGAEELGESDEDGDQRRGEEQEDAQIKEGGGVPVAQVGVDGIQRQDVPAGGLPFDCAIDQTSEHHGDADQQA